MSEENEVKTKGNSNVFEEPEKVDFQEDRGQWGRQLEFILTLVGYAVGLGNVWRFPYLCYKNGGGAFLIPYTLMLVFIGMPMFFLEISLGQFASLGPVKIWTANPLFKGVGISMMAVQTFSTIYYQILVTYILYYLFASMTDVLPWTDCGNNWNTYQCLTAYEVSNDSYVEEWLNRTGLEREDIKTPSEEYYYENVLQLSDGIEYMGSIVWQLALCLLMVWIIIFLVLLKGVGSLGKVVYFTTIFPYIMMTIMIIRGCTLDGAAEGLRYYLYPDLERLKDSVVWSDAANQIFFSLSACTGGLMAMASYNKFHNNVYRDGVMIPIINCVTSVYVGLAIFSVLGYMAKVKGVEVPDVVDSGPGLIFVVYPEALATMPAAPLWSILFFFMMLTLGFSSSFSQAESLFVALMDQFPGTLRSTPTRPLILRSLSIICFYLISLPLVTEGGFYLFNILDTYAGGLPRIFVGFFVIVAMVWIYGISNLSEDICMMIGRHPPMFFKICWLVITPLIIIFIIGFRIATNEPLVFGDYIYPNWANTLGWLIVAFILLWIPVWWLYEFFKNDGGKFLKSLAAPTIEWGPANKENQTGRYYHATKPIIEPHHAHHYTKTMDYLSSAELTHRTGKGTQVELNLSPAAFIEQSEKSSQL